MDHSENGIRKRLVEIDSNLRNGKVRLEEAVELYENIAMEANHYNQPKLAQEALLKFAEGCVSLGHSKQVNSEKWFERAGFAFRALGEKTKNPLLLRKSVISFERASDLMHAKGNYQRVGFYSNEAAISQIKLDKLHKSIEKNKIKPRRIILKNNQRKMPRRIK